MSNTCMECGSILTSDDVGLHKKLISRMAEEYLCKTCISKKLGCPISLLDEKIRRFKEDGCLLFV